MPSPLAAIYKGAVCFRFIFDIRESGDKSKIPIGKYMKNFQFRTHVT